MKRKYAISCLERKFWPMSVPQELSRCIVIIIIIIIIIIDSRIIAVGIATGCGLVD
jgi:hypothetical protein